ALAARFPQIDPRGLRWALLEAKAGAILSRGACRALLAAFLRAGGRFRLARVPAPGAGMSEGARGRRLSRLDCTDGRPLRADQYLFACGPWLPGLFPALLGRRIAVTRKDVYYFGTPAGETRFDGSELPVWMELGTLCYGIPSLAGLGFKVNPDLPGARVEPSSLERQPSRRVLNAARACLARRFPAMSAAPLLGARVCQYESTADDHMIFDRHPGYDNVWLAGGGSGHCFKHGPAIGELVASALTARSTDRIPEPLRLSHVARGRHF
ncbi:MAG TPA: FAD-dependent oxidoreductase, partial [Candidatus Polarisedimenticolia bacterium]|nr:FAD-dependent oxidoreductase [Candidatus Polarisedimenticolia bacterium]